MGLIVIATTIVGICDSYLYLQRLCLGLAVGFCYNGLVMEVNKFVARLEQDFPELKFRRGKKFAFRPLRTIVYEQFCDDGVNESTSVGQNSAIDAGGLVRQAKQRIKAESWRQYQLCLLHELGHATLGHREFRTDPERIKMEVAAWKQAERLSERYGVEFDEEFAERKLDSYRDWLHQKSRCPECGLTRYQAVDGRYHCPGCLVMGLDRE